MIKFAVIEGECAETRDPDQGAPPKFSDESLALEFAARHADGLRYVAAWSKWFVWDGKVWCADSTLRAVELARVLCREAAARAERGAQAIASAKTVTAVERLARADRRLAATIDQWDADPWLLNTPAGVVDLRTGETRAHAPVDYMTKIAATGASGDCPTWRAFLHRVTGGDTELQSFLQRVTGYALTGSTREHALVFLYGTGANGKTVFNGTVSAVLGDYHTTAPIETFTASSMDRHPTELAGLRGARLVTAVETEEGRRWAEARIKALTGGDAISARFMRQDFFQFVPTFKLMITGNHKPGLRTVDEAIRRRFLLVPFAVTIPAGERDPMLLTKLRSEWPGILAWAIEGCRVWQRDSLSAPAAVLDATAKYLEAEDAMAAWLDEACEISPKDWSSSSDLFGSWKAWAERSGEYVGSEKKFSQHLETRGFQREKKKVGRGFRGLHLRPVEYQSSWPHS